MPPSNLAGHEVPANHVDAATLASYEITSQPNFTYTTKNGNTYSANSREEILNNIECPLGKMGLEKAMVLLDLASTGSSLLEDLLAEDVGNALAETEAAVQPDSVKAEKTNKKTGKTEPTDEATLNVTPKNEVFNQSSQITAPLHVKEKQISRTSELKHASTILEKKLPTATETLLPRVAIEPGVPVHALAVQAAGSEAALRKATTVETVSEASAGSQIKQEAALVVQPNMVDVPAQVVKPIVRKTSETKTLAQPELVLATKATQPDTILAKPLAVDKIIPGTVEGVVSLPAESVHSETIVEVVPITKSNTVELRLFPEDIIEESDSEFPITAATERFTGIDPLDLQVIEFDGEDAPTESNFDSMGEASLQPNLDGSIITVQAEVTDLNLTKWAELGSEDPIALYEDFTAALVQLVDMNAAPEEYTPTYDSDDLSHAEEIEYSLSDEVGRGAELAEQPVPQIVAVVAEKMAEIADETKMVMAPIVVAIVETISLLQDCAEKTTELEPADAELAFTVRPEAQLEELVRALFMTIDIDYQEADIQAFMVSVLRPEFVPVQNQNILAVDLETEGTREVKLGARQIVSARLSARDMVRQLLGKVGIWNIRTIGSQVAA